MKTKTLVTAILLLFAVSVTQAQDKVKMYSFSVYVSNGTSSSCSDIDKAYVSPIVSYQFEKYLDNDYVDDRDTDHQTNKLNSKWAKKCQARFNIESTYCWGHYGGGEVWQESRSQTDEERDETVINLKRQGYTVYDDYSFGFYFN